MADDRSRLPANIESHLNRILREHRALAILRILERSTSYACNASLLSDLLDVLALGGTREVVRSTLEWLEQVGAVRITATDTIIVATLTDWGADLAAGKISTEGILKPGPECPY